MLNDLFVFDISGVMRDILGAAAYTWVSVSIVGALLYRYSSIECEYL